MVERQRNGNFRVILDHDERVRVNDIPTQELADAVDRSLHEAYQRGRANPFHRWDDDNDD